MDIEILRAPYRARPFRPFQIHTASGGVFAVKSPENIAFTVDGRGLVVSPAGGEVALIDVSSVTEVTYDFKKPRKTTT
jgi:hypothetical protein